MGIELMYIPLIQGTIRYAHTVAVRQGSEKAKAEGAVFAASVLPRVHAADPEAAKIIYNNMRVGATSTDHIAVKKAFESVYADMGIKCSDVGGVWNLVLEKHYDDMEPCIDPSTTEIEISVQKEEDETLATILGATFGGLFGIALLGLCFMRSKEKRGQPVFAPHLEQEEGDTYADDEKQAELY